MRKNGLPSSKRWPGGSTEHPVFYQDEVDIDLNPKIGANWMPKEQQKRIATPGQNRKHYLAGALHSVTGKIHYVSGISKSSDLFISLLEILQRIYRRAKTITLVLDNYVIHKSRRVGRWLEKNTKFRAVSANVFTVAESDRTAVVIPARNRNAKSSMPVYVAVTETGKSVYESSLAIPQQSTRTG